MPNVGICAWRGLLRSSLLLYQLSMDGLACAPRHTDDVEPYDPNAVTDLSLTNNNWNDVTVLVLHDGELSRVGEVTAASTAHFSLPAWMLGHSRTVRLVARPIGSNDRAITDLLVIQQGQVVEWTLESHLDRSYVTLH